MKKTFRLMALAVLTLALSACSGGSKSILFGSLPGIMEKVASEQQKLEDEAKNISSAEEKAELIKKSAKLKEKWTPKITKAAEALDGKELPVESEQFNITTPLSLTLRDLTSKDMVPVFKVQGEASLKDEYRTDTYVKYFLSRYVSLQGLDAEGNVLFTSKIGAVPMTDEGTVAIIKPGTKVEFSTLKYRLDDNEAYTKIKTLKLVLDVAK